MPGLIAFLYGLGGGVESWGAVPQIVQASLGPTFTVQTLDYSAGLRGKADIATSADRILTTIQAIYPQHEPIYLIGHSLGGLIARQICQHLLEFGPDDLLNKIPAAITAGTPLEGARVGNFLLRCLPVGTPKIGELATAKRAFDGYKRAIEIANTRSVRKPKQLHIRIEDDAVIAAHVKANFTDDDEAAGVIPGTHTNFVKNANDAAYVANVLLTVIRTRQNSFSKPFLAAPLLVAERQLPDRLILIACSHTKRDGGATYGGPLADGWISGQSLRQRTISRRSYIYGILRDAKIEDGFERGGNRAHQPANRHLKYGPDFGGNVIPGEEGRYMPAWQRYNGRIYNYITDAAWQSYFHNQNRVQVLIMSGLFGLLDATEWIQNYDVHLTDTNKDSGLSISSMWSELYTECLETYVKSACQNRKVKIFDFLCDHHYVDAVKWHKLPKECSVFHLASPTVEDVALLPPAGTIIDSLLLNPERLEDFVREMSALITNLEHLAIRLPVKRICGSSSNHVSE